MVKPTTFDSISDAIGAANYVQQLLNAEYQWINNRVSWLFVSQSFCITAYAILTTSTGVRFGKVNTIAVLELGLPLFGIICCAVVGLAVFAATRVAGGLASERGRLVHYINENSPTTIHLSSIDAGLREAHWTYWFGELPHVVLPWVLGLLWLSLVIL